MGGIREGGIGVSSAMIEFVVVVAVLIGYIGGYSVALWEYDIQWDENGKRIK